MTKYWVQKPSLGWTIWGLGSAQMCDSQILHLPVLSQAATQTSWVTLSKTHSHLGPRFQGSPQLYKLMTWGEQGKESCEGQNEVIVIVQVGHEGTGWHRGKRAPERLYALCSQR